MKNTDSVRRKMLQSGQPRRKVKFRKPVAEIQLTKDKIPSCDSELDLNLFEGPVDPDLICKICHRVLVHPQVTSCQHVICVTCLQDNIGKECPTCRAPIDRASVQQPPVQLRLRLLELRIHCDHKCGQVLPLGELPRHVGNECPNTPVSCHNAKKGCKMKVKRCQLQEHTSECVFRPVECEACGEMLVYNDLVLHQKKNRCVENRIKNQLVHAIRSTHLEVSKHRKTLEHQRVQIETQQRRIEINHVRQLQTLKSHKRRSSLCKEPSFSSSFNDGHSIDSSRHRQIIPSSLPNKLMPISLSAQHSSLTPRQLSSQQRSVRQVIHPIPIVVSDKDRNNNNTNETNNVFVTTTDYAESEDIKDDPSVQLHTNGDSSAIPSRGMQDGQFICRRCNKRIREGGNKANSCRWHVGPIIELFGGTCYTCGRLDYQHGCMVGCHEA